MMISNAEQFTRLFLSLGFGLWLNLYHRLLRLRPPREPYRAVKQFLLDWWFGVSSAVIFFLFSLAVSSGVVRLGMLLAVSVGFWVGEHTVGRWFTAAVCRVSRGVAAVCESIRQKNARFCCKAGIFFKKITVFFKKGLHSLCGMVYNRKR